MRKRTPIEQARWRRSQIAETFASVRVSAPCYRFAEYVGFLAVIEAKLKLVQVQRQIFFVHFVVTRSSSNRLFPFPHGKGSG
jgi:hypothetical protein